METITTKVLIELDFDVNQKIGAEVKKARKVNSSEETKEQVMGQMIAKQYKLEALLNRKKMTYSELITLLNNK